jgi:phosphopantothenate-cysteine ligase
LITYACAAVSDYYIPNDQLIEHKILSGQNELIFRLEPVPKLLGFIKGEYEPKAFLVSFKLETDEKILEDKCLQSPEIYNQNIIIGNIVKIRTNQVRIFERKEKQWTIIIRSQDKEIKIEIIKFLSNKHQIYYA